MKGRPKIEEKPYNSLSAWLKERFGCKVYKVTIDAGFTCPNKDGSRGTGGCVYCESTTLIPEVYAGKHATISEQLTKGIEKVRRRHGAEKFIAYFQLNTSTYAPAEELRRIYAPAVEHPDVAGVAVSTRPDCVDDEVLDLLSCIKSKKHLWLELGLQSARDTTLERINRGHTSEDFAGAARRARERGIDVCAHIIVGLPGESGVDLLDTIAFIKGLGVWGVKFHQLQVIKGTELERLYNRGEVRVLSLEEYTGLVVESIEALPPEVVIHRLSGDVPQRFLVAPRWGANKFIIMERIRGLMAAKRTRQGSRFGPSPRPR